MAVWYHRVSSSGNDQKIAGLALKGAGKSSVVAGLGLALVEKGFKVGFLDIDTTGSNLFSASSLPHSPRWEPDSTNEKNVQYPHPI